MSMQKRLVQGGAVAAAGYLGWKYVDDKYQISSDLEMAKKLLGMKKEIAKGREEGWNVTSVWYRAYAKNPSKICFYYLDETVTFQQVEDRSNQVSHFLLKKGIKPGDTISLLMENRPEFVICWLGMSKIGVKVALINTSIVQKGLIHCVKISECKMLMFGSELAASVRDIQTELEELGIFICAEGSYDSAAEGLDFAENATPHIAQEPTSKTDESLRKGIGMMDTFGYIYTSGTTGLPKAAIILHQKMITFGALMCRGYGVQESDIVYTCLPLFHSAGGGLGIGMMLYSGCSVVIKKKFSAREFWKDCVKYKCTVIQYIGELCRYLILQPPVPEESQHRVRVAIGNGLRPEIWDEFQDRFHIPEVGEFYGATEGNSALLNHCRTKEARGSVGRFGSLLMKITGTRLARFDVISEEPIRDPKTGFCIDCKPDEPGELLFIIKDDDPSTTFVGYNNKAATEKKIIRDAFVKGDKYFRTGDLLSRDSHGFFRFVDRIGDTFRWKGENCSTTEVTEVLGTFPGIEEVNVYGVQIPNNMDGRAPMVAITPVDNDLSKIDLVKLYAFSKKNLPPYAIPLFLRILPQMEVTATMKHQKVKLREEGIELNKVGSDKLFWLNPDSKAYEPFGEEEFKKVTALQAKL